LKKSRNTVRDNTILDSGEKALVEEKCVRENRRKKKRQKKTGKKVNKKNESSNYTKLPRRRTTVRRRTAKPRTEKLSEIREKGETIGKGELRQDNSPLKN